MALYVIQYQACPIPSVFSGHLSLFEQGSVPRISTPRECIFKRMTGIESTIVYLALGSNLGNRENYLHCAVESLKSAANSPIEQSSIYETPPVGPGRQGPYLNLCISFQTRFSAERLHTACRGVETGIGRQKRIKWGPREIDIDILFYGNRIIRTPALTIPHPEMAGRQFVLVPLSDIAPGFIHPVSGKPVSVMLRDNILLSGRDPISLHHTGACCS